MNTQQYVPVYVYWKSGAFNMRQNCSKESIRGNESDFPQMMLLAKTTIPKT